MIGYDYTVLIADKKTEGSIKHWLNNDLVPSITILHEAQVWLYRRLRIREMLATATGTMAIGEDTIALPDRYVAPRYLTFTGTEAAEIKRKRLEEIERTYAYDQNGDRVLAKPVMYYTDATALQLDCPADKAYAWRFIHYAELAPLTSDNPSNVLTGRGFLALRAAAMASAARWDKQDSVEGWIQEAMAHVMELNVEDDQEQAGTEMVMQVM